MPAARGALRGRRARRRRGCGREPGTEETATPEHPLVIDAPRLVVASGPDTTVVMGPTLFALFGIDPGWVEEALSILERQRMEWGRQKGLAVG